MSDKRIKQTKNYRLFKRSDDNRRLDLSKHRGLRRSMEQFGWLPSFPMVVRKDGNDLVIVDGQHRFAIAETLGLVVYFVIEDKLFDVAVVNTAQRPWTIADYAERFAQQELKDYQVGLEFSKSNSIPVGTAFALLAGTISFSNIQDDFKSGQFKIKDMFWAESVACIYVPFVRASKAVRNARFIEACMAVCRVDGFDRGRLLSGLDRCREKLVAYSTRDHYLQMIEDIYNFGRRGLVPLKISAISAMKLRNAAVAKSARKRKRGAA